MALGAADDRTRSAMLAAGAVVVAALSGCVEQRAGPAPSGQAARLPGEGFFFDQEGGEAKLAYGRANSDDVRLMLRCEAGQRQVEITDAGGEARSGERLVLRSGKARSALPATVVTNEESGGKLTVAHADAALPALDGFRRSGSITVALGSREYALSATAAERDGIARFFRVCERR